MNKKEIIIDGVNVKDCKRRFGKNSYCRYFKRPCADNNFNCIWKQHERLKEENKALRKRFEKLVSDLGWHCVQCTKEADNCMLRIENEKLKKTLQEIEKLSENAYCLTNRTNKDMAEFAKTIMMKISEVIK